MKINRKATILADWTDMDPTTFTIFLCTFSHTRFYCFPDPKVWPSTLGSIARPFSSSQKKETLWWDIILNRSLEKHRPAISPQTSFHLQHLPSNRNYWKVKHRQAERGTSKISSFNRQLFLLKILDRQFCFNRRLLCSQNGSAFGCPPQPKTFWHN